MKFIYQNCFLFSLFTLFSCINNHTVPTKEQLSKLNLKRGDVIACGPSDLEFGKVDFKITGDAGVNTDFNMGLELLHSFEYDEAEKVFAKIIDRAPATAMAYWGVAMCNFHPLWEPPTDANLEAGLGAIKIAESLPSKTPLENAFIQAAAAYYRNWRNTDVYTRSIHFENAMAQLYNRYPGEKEAAIFYALSLVSAADPADKTYARQKKAGAILQKLYVKDPKHPGIIHYIIHTYDYPGLAAQALPAAKNYAAVAPSSAHAQHMPSHIFIRLGIWDDAIQSNLQSVASAQCYAKTAGIKGHWDEELHGLDYLVYAYLQKKENTQAYQQLKYLSGINEVYPVNFKVAYAFAAIPSRIVLENKNWKEAASLQLHPTFAWNKFPWQESIVHFTRVVGLVHTGNLEKAKEEFKILNALHDTLQLQKDLYKARQVEVQVKCAQGLLDYGAGNMVNALILLEGAAAMEDSVAKHPVTPGEVLPARELYADMLLKNQQHEKALGEYVLVLQKSPGRFNSLYGASVAAAGAGKKEQANYYLNKLPSRVKDSIVTVVAAAIK